MENYLLPNYIKEYSIYDIYYNDNGYLIIITPYEYQPLNILYYDNINIYNFKIYKCPHNHTYIYTLKIEYNENIKISINNNVIETYVNKYPDFNNEIIFSTIVKNEDDYIKQWIDFHYNLGINRFIIYDNTDTDTYNLGTILNDYIKTNIVVLIKWSYQYILPISGISGQTTQQNHSIYAFQNCKYIGLFDIDEYINIQKNTKININEFFNNIINKYNIDLNNISSFRLLNKFFYNPYNLPTDGKKFINIYDCNYITKSGREKNFVIPKNVKTFSIHMVTDGLPMYSLNENEIYFNHYCFLNKLDRGKNNTTNIDNSILVHL